MNSGMWQALSPLLALSGGTVVLMLQIAFHRNPRWSVAITQLSLLLGAGLLLWLWPGSDYQSLLLRVDGYALLLNLLFILAAAVTCWLSPAYIALRSEQSGEFFLLLLLATIGAMILAQAVHVASLLLGLELLGVALYALIAYPDRSLLPLEAAVKYLVLSGAASATLLFGFALAYAGTGQLAFTGLSESLALAGSGAYTLVMAASVMIICGLAFKLSLVPFHMWTPDVYQGAPSPVTGFLATVSKGAVFAVFLRAFLETGAYQFPIILNSLAAIAVASMLVGNLLALRQDNVKRLLAYSSIAHMGYLLIVLLVCSDPANHDLAVEAALFYLVAYTVTTLAAFAVLTWPGYEQYQGPEHTELKHLSGLLWHHPLAGLLMLVAMLSLAGIPLTAGFVGKFYLFSAAVTGPHWLLLGSLVVGSGIGIYYYLRVVYYLLRRDDNHALLPNAGWHESCLAVVLLAAVLGLGIAPQSLIGWIQSIL